MKHDDFQKMCKVLRLLDCTVPNTEIIAQVKVKEFVDNLSKFESDLNEIVNFYNTNSLEKESVIMDKKGKVYLIKCWQIGNDETTGNIAWVGAKVTDRMGVETVLKMDEIVPYTKASEVLFGEKNS